MKSFSSLMAEQTLLPIIQANSVEEGLNIAKAMDAAGITLVEVVLRTQASLAVLSEIKKALPKLIVGAGTILSEADYQAALAAGADFIITPASSDKLLTLLKQSPVPVLPGVASSADILLAREHGYSELKLFPAALSGGIPFLSAMSSIFQDIIFCPTGGINADNQKDYLNLSNVFAVGGTWVAPKKWLDEKNWQQITLACQAANQ